MTAAFETKCCIVGGGPAGMMLGVLLSRAGVRTVVLEKHADCLRDFRDDTIHPSTLGGVHPSGEYAEEDWPDDETPTAGTPRNYHR